MSVDAELRRTKEQLRLSRIRLLQAEREITALRNSRSWALTAPLRQLGQRFPGIVGGIWIGTKVIGWLFRGELRARIGAWRMARSPWVGPELAVSAVAAPAPTCLYSRGCNGRRGTVLVADMCVPQPDRGAGYRTTFVVLEELLRQGYAVTFWPEDGADFGSYTQTLERMGVEVLDRRSARDIRAWLSDVGSKLDYAVIMRPYLSYQLLPNLLAATPATIIYYGHDLHYARLRIEAAYRRDPDLADRAERMFQMERAVWRAVDVVLYPSQEEVSTVKKIEPYVDARVLTPFAYDSVRLRDLAPSGTTILFVGGYQHRPNVGAAFALVRSILPLIRRSIPHARLVLAGADPPRELIALANDNVEVTGRISDEVLSALYKQARVVVIPLRVGAGVKGKVVEAMHEGVPVVTTSIGAQGMQGLEDIVPVCDDDADLASAAVTLLSDDNAWLRQSRAQSDFVQQHFSTTNLRRTLLHAMGAEPLRT